MGTLILSVSSWLTSFISTSVYPCITFYQRLKDVGDSAIELLVVMLEAPHEKSQSLAQWISDDLDIRALLSAELKLDALLELKVKLSKLYVYW